jgi:hypothetical protein
MRKIVIALAIFASIMGAVSAQDGYGGYFTLNGSHTVTFNGVTISALSSAEGIQINVSTDATQEKNVWVQVGNISQKLPLNPENGFKNSTVLYGYGNSTAMVEYSW